MLIVGENITVSKGDIASAVKERNAGPIIEMAKEQKQAGANYIDINIGPATKNGEELMQWLVESVQSGVDVNLALDTKNIDAIEAGLKVHKGAAMINSVTGDKDKLDILMPMAKKYNSKIVGIALTRDGVPPDVDSRLEIAINIVNSAMEHGVPVGDLYLDPLVLPVSVLQEQVSNCINALEAFKELKEVMGLDDEPKTIVGLSNVSQSSPGKLKSLLNRIYLVILMSHGLDSAILNPLDRELMNAVKTFDILTNKILYAHSYLD
jgi:5-methyltetrahydrofolate corrinoid/iron sulfur protein methyltransferase